VGRELDEEMGGFLEMAAQEKMSQGMSRKAALREVRLERGSLEIAKEVVSAATWESVLETCWQDLRIGCRTLCKSPSFTVVSGESLIDFGSVFSTWIVMRVLPRQVWIALKERGATPARNRRHHAVETNGPSQTAFRCLLASPIARSAIGGPKLDQPDLATPQ